MAFSYYDAERIVMGKPMKDWTRFAMAWWHTYVQTEAIRSGTNHHPWDIGNDACDKSYA
jgi:xylose isomerase